MHILSYERTLDNMQHAAGVADSLDHKAKVLMADNAMDAHIAGRGTLLVKARLGRTCRRRRNILRVDNHAL